MLGVRVCALHRLLDLHIHICLFVLPVVVDADAQGRVAVLDVEKGGLPHKDVPQVSLPVVAGKDLADAGYLPLRQGLDGDIVVHLFFILSQPFDGCVQKPQPVQCLLNGGLHRCPLGQQARLHGGPVLPAGQQRGRLCQGEPQAPQGGDPVGGHQLGRRVPAVAGPGIGLLRHQQADLIVVAQHPDADSGQL